MVDRGEGVVREEGLGVLLDRRDVAGQGLEEAVELVVDVEDDSFADAGGGAKASRDAVELNAEALFLLVSVQSHPHVGLKHTLTFTWSSQRPWI